MNNTKHLNNNNDSELELGTKIRNDFEREFKTEEKEFKPKILPQLLAGVSANFAAFAWGCVMSWSATALPKIEGDPDFVETDADQRSWISSIAALGACIVCLPTAFMLERFGRRKSMLFFAPLYATGWLLMYFSNGLAMVIAGRAITGFSGGLFSIATPSYLAETSGRKIRGMLINGYDMMICCGMLFVAIVGTYTSWRVSALICAFVPVIVFMMMFFMPESPRFLMSKGMEEEASKSLIWLRGAKVHEEILVEFEELKENILENKDDSWGDRFKEFRKGPILKAFFLSLILFQVQVFTGIAAVLFNQVTIFKDAGTSLNENHSSMIVGAVEIVASIGAALVVDRFGRRILLISSQFLLVLSLGGLGAFFHVADDVDREFAVTNLEWLPLTALIIYLVGYSVGIGPVPYSIMPEILPQRVRGLAAGMVMTVKWGMTFIVTRFYHKIIEGLGNDGCYWLFASLCLAGGIYIFFFIPETKKLTLEQIQVKYFSKKLKSKHVDN